MLKIGILGSTRGSDLPSIVKSIKKGELKGLVRIALVISDKKDSGILEKARNYGIKHYYLNPKGITRIGYDEIIAEELDTNNVQL